VSGKSEVVVLLLAELDLTPLRAELAVGATLLVGEELLLADAVVARTRGLVDPAALARSGIFVLPESGQDGTDALPVLLRCGCRPSVEADAELFPKCQELGGDAVDILLRGDPLALGALLDLLAVLVDPSEEEDILPACRWKRASTSASTFS